MVKTETKITRYENELFYIDIVDDAIFYEAWQTPKGGSTSRLISAVVKDRDDGLYVDEEAFLATVEYYLDNGAECYPEEEDSFEIYAEGLFGGGLVN